jgi:Domain of unknown function (DUF4224)
MMSKPSNDPPPLFLTDAELEFYTGYTQPAAQIRFLQKWQVRHVVNGMGRPRVTRAAVEGSERPKVGPNFDALRKSDEERTKNSKHWYYQERRKALGIPEPKRASEAGAEPKSPKGSNRK